ncbi:MAG TPA: hypothetical protein VK348_02440 [Planctomycetota bacterium]|nr:hypothetical protein [Planctomycetota bacterium]
MNILNAAVAAAVLAALGLAQDAAPTASQQPKPKLEHPQSGPQADADRPGQGADFALRARRFLATHPELREKLKQQADTDGDGKLSPDELRHADELLRAKMTEFRQREGKLDHNGDGVVEPGEIERARAVREEVREHAGQDGNGQGNDHPRGGLDGDRNPDDNPATGKDNELKDRVDDHADADGFDDRVHPTESKTEAPPQQRGLPAPRRAPVAAKPPATDPKETATTVKKGHEPTRASRADRPSSSGRSQRPGGGSQQ